MSYNTTIRNDRGDAVTIRVELSGAISGASWSVSLEVLPKGKRKPVYPCREIAERTEYRVLSLPERVEYMRQAILEWVSQDQIDEALMAAWRAISPANMPYTVTV